MSEVTLHRSVSLSVEPPHVLAMLRTVGPLGFSLPGYSSHPFEIRCVGSTQDQTRSNCKSQSLGFQEQYTPKVEFQDVEYLRGTPRPGLFLTIAPRKI
jgi:hypothetical protein